MWKHATDAEQQLSEDLFANNARTLPAVDAATIPDEPKSKDDPAPNAADEEEVADAVEDEAEAQPAAQPAAQPPAQPAVQAEAATVANAGAGTANVGNNDTEPPAKKQCLNTTSFPYWPDPASTD